ncbi:hypothetical protein K505DRAFT_343923 [Melanomma pulvis-pyrius CBS 109.77]|uniref:AA1-like domain-containing protein n=1 Tax=Melanomma pulvis-pyrius CBS 109.77 TaxID=1314802 RepID=A0A6A6WQX4_9PLEO|nr:hypothetical protein K505DRAFT_343923 [Melanomma pulvis-pyrius CBS 109.77]
MRLIPALLVLLTPFTHGQLPFAPPTLHITNFSALISTSPSIPSHIAFNVLDPRPTYFASINCIFSTNETYPSIYLDGWWHCDPLVDVAFWFEDDFLMLRRVWLDDPSDPRSRVIGVTDKQDTAWSEGTIDACANATASVAGLHFSRTTDWEFPITTILT